MKFFRFHPGWMVLAALFCLGLLPLAATANPTAQLEIEARMEARLPAIAALKRAGAVGENNQGYLEARTELTEEQQALVEADRRDREAIYTLIATRTGETVASVGQQRAVLIARRSPPGVWLQAADGTWYQR